MKDGDQRRVASLSVYSLAAAAAAAALTAATAAAGTTGAFSAPPQQRQQLHNGGTVTHHGLSSFIPPPSPCTTDPTSRHACPAAAAGRHALGSSTTVVSGAGGRPVFTAGSRWVRRRGSAVPRVAGGVRQQQGVLPARGAGAADGPATGVSRPTQGRGGDGKEEGAMRKLDERDLRQRKFTKGMKQLGYRGGWKAVRGLIAEAGRVGLPLNVICLNAAMSVLARSGRWYEALDLLSMMRRGALLVDVDGGGGGSGADQGTGFREPRVEGEEASSSPMLVLPEPDTITFNAAITACGRGNKWKSAVELLDSMRREGLVPDGFSYSAAITACKNCGQWETALGLLDDMRMRGLGRDRHSLNAAIAACASAGRWKPAMEILEGMEMKGPSPDVFTYGAVIDALAHGGEVDLALRTLKRMRSDPSRYPAPNTVCHNAALMALMRDGRWREARNLLSEVVSATSATGGSVELDFLSYNTVIRACAAAGEAEEALKTREEMRAAGIPADAYTYEALSTACGLAGNWAAAEAVVREMEEEEEEEAARSAEATQTAAAAGMLPSLSPAIYAAAANALADVGEWEWCLVLLEELEQLDMGQDDEATGAAATTAAALSPPPPAGVALASAADDNNGEEQEAPGDGRADAAAPETVLRVELDESGALAAPATASSEEEAMSAMEAAAAAAAATYTAAVRACGEGGAGVQAVVGVLERMRWAGADPGEDTYAAAISAFRACGGAREGEEASGRGVLSAEEAARALVDHETGRDGGADWASPFLYSAAVKACAEAGEFAAGRLFFVEGRRAAGVATDDAAEVAAAAVAAAAAAADSGSAPKRPARVNPGVEAVYMSCLTMCAAAGDGSLARDVLRWMKLEGFQAGEEAYMLAIEACCNPTVPQDSPAAPQQQSSFATPPATSRQRLPLPPPAVTSGATSPEDLAGVRRKLFSEGKAPESEQLSAAAATSEVVTVNPPPPRDDGDDGVAAVVRSATAGTSVPGVEDPASSVDEDVERGRVTEKVPAAAAAAVESMNQQRPQPPLVEEEERKAERPELEWVVIPGGRLSPPEFDEDGNEKNIAPPGTMGGAAWATGGATAGAGGSGAVGFGGGDGAPFPLEGEVTTAAASRRDGDGGTTSPASARADVSRAGAVNVLSPLAAATPAAPAAAGGGRSSGQGRTPPVHPDAVVAAGSSSTPTAAAADEGGSSSVSGSGASSTDSKRSVSNNNNGGAGGGGADWERARAILDDMTAADHLPPPPEEAFRAVLSACDSAGRVGEALEIAQVMVGAGFRPSIALMARLMASHADELDRERREMEEAAAEPAEEWGETS